MASFSGLRSEVGFEGFSGVLGVSGPRSYQGLGFRV